MQVRLPQYLHLPPQVLWFDSHELMVLLLAFCFSLILKSWLWVPLMIGAGLIISVKRKRPRGWLLHILYRVGIVRTKGYPLPTAKRFEE